MTPLAQLVTDVQAEPESIASIAEALGRHLPAAQGRDAWAATKHVGQFLEASTRAFLGWVSTGRDEQARELVEELERLLSHEGTTDPMASRPPAEHLAVGIRQLLFVARTYLKTDNLALPLSKLQGQRRRTWRLALHLADGAGGMLTVPSVLESELFEQRNTADNALNELAKLGLLERQDRDYVVMFRLTFAGRQVCRELQRMQIDAEGDVVRARGGWRREVPSHTHGNRAQELRQRKQRQAVAKAVMGASGNFVPAGATRSGTQGHRQSSRRGRAHALSG